ncbi:MAG: hypothetical protein FWH04_07825 [Oscillospiraceae bacterium]|nr:hypothetical protein [Oscillospiraceae bacterium]
MKRLKKIGSIFLIVIGGLGLLSFVFIFFDRQEDTIKWIPAAIYSVYLIATNIFSLVMRAKRRKP